MTETREAEVDLRSLPPGTPCTHSRTRHSFSAGYPSSRCQTPCFLAAGAYCSSCVCFESPISHINTHTGWIRLLAHKRQKLKLYAALCDVCFQKKKENEKVWATVFSFLKVSDLLFLTSVRDGNLREEKWKKRERERQGRTGQRLASNLFTLIVTTSAMARSLKTLLF